MSIYEIGSEFDIESNKNIYLNINNLNLKFKNLMFYRSGRDALRVLAKKYTTTYKQILMPALCCESMVSPFEQFGYEVIFYKLNEDFSANFFDISKKMKSNTILLFMNYFGNKSLSCSDLSNLKTNYTDLIVIEDKTHDFLSHDYNDYIPDYCIISIRKWVSVPDGGLLYFNDNKIEYSFEEDQFFTENRLKALELKSQYLKFGDQKQKEIYRQLLKSATDHLDSDKKIVPISNHSIRILYNIDFKLIYKIRNMNLKFLYTKLKKLIGIEIIKHINSNDSVVYFPILVKNRDSVQEKLIQKNVFCPVIWPLPQAAKGICEFSDYISNNILALPIDQRYNIRDMKYIVQSLVDSIEY